RCETVTHFWRGSRPPWQSTGTGKPPSGSDGMPSLRPTPGGLAEGAARVKTMTTTCASRRSTASCRWMPRTRSPSSRRSWRSAMPAPPVCDARPSSSSRSSAVTRPKTACLRGLYAKLTGEDLKEKVIFSLSQMGGADNGRWLMDIALNEREPVEMRKKALFWVGQTGGNLDQLAGLYDRMQNREMKEQLIFVYSQRRSEEHTSELQS